MLHYLFIYRQGDVYNKLLNLLQHHSLSQLLVELLQIKIVNSVNGESNRNIRDRFSSDFDDRFGRVIGNNDDDEEDKKEKVEEDPTAGMTTIERKMYEVLKAKKQEVVNYLIRQLTSSNKDLEQSLNAHSILLEMADNDQTYGKLVEK